MATATGRAPANGVVQEGAGGVVIAHARGGSEGRTTTMRRACALARPGRVMVRSGMAWASWARLGTSVSGQCRARLRPGIVLAGSGECGESL
jgi:hypothetical protein